MLAFSKSIVLKDPTHPEESKNSELKAYMDYQRKLDHERIIYHALDHAKTYLQKSMSDFVDDEEKLNAYLKKTFPLSHAATGSADMAMLMLRKLMNGHNSSNNWYRMNPYYYALAYDCIKRFTEIYNRLVGESPEKAEEYRISEGLEIDFDDWAYLFFPDLDFHIGKGLGYTHYPLAKRNKQIEEKITAERASGKSLEEALESLKEKYKLDAASIKILLGKEIDSKDLELFYTSVENPIYEYLSQKGEGSWEVMDGESLLDQAYYMGSTLKVWVWRKREEAESTMDDLASLQKK